MGKFFVFFEHEIVKRRRNVALAYNKEVVTLLVEEIHTDLNNHPLCTDPTGHGLIEGTSDSVAFYLSQVVGVVKG